MSTDALEEILNGALGEIETNLKGEVIGSQMGMPVMIESAVRDAVEKAFQAGRDLGPRDRLVEREAMVERDQSTAFLRVTSQPGWNRATPMDRAVRRALWWRDNLDKERDEKKPIDLPWLYPSVELCAGREGDDCYFKLSAGEIVTQKMLNDLREVLLSERYATEMDEGWGPDGNGIEILPRRPERA